MMFQIFTQVLLEQMDGVLGFQLAKGV